MKGDLWISRKRCTNSESIRTASDPDLLTQMKNLPLKPLGHNASKGNRKDKRYDEVEGDTI